MDRLFGFVLMILVLFVLCTNSKTEYMTEQEAIEYGENLGKTAAKLEKALLDGQKDVDRVTQLIKSETNDANLVKLVNERALYLKLLTQLRLQYRQTMDEIYKYTVKQGIELPAKPGSSNFDPSPISSLTSFF